MSDLQYAKNITHQDLLYAPLWYHHNNLQQTTSGYGRKLATPWMVRYAGKLRRVYVTIYSNSGTHWIIYKKQRLIVNV